MPTRFAVFQQYSVEPLLAPIVRNGKEESVVVVARKSNEVIYWEESRPWHLSVRNGGREGIRTPASSLRTMGKIS